jgi:hypothetical protein
MPRIVWLTCIPTLNANLRERGYSSQHNSAALQKIEVAADPLFQAICRTNRLDGDDKDFGHVVDFKRLVGILNEHYPGWLNAREELNALPLG